MASTLKIERKGTDVLWSDLPVCGVCISSWLGPKKVYGKKKGSVEGCGHYFHLKCIKKAIEYQELGVQIWHPRCPTCRRPIFKLYPAGHSGPVFTVKVQDNRGSLQPCAYFVDSDDELPM